MTTQNASSHCQMSHEVKNHLQLRSTALEGMFFNILTPLWYLLPQDKLYSPLLSCFSCVQLFVTPRNYNPLAPLSMEFFRQEYWSGLPCPPPGDLPGPGIEPASLMPPALAGGFFTTSATWEAHSLGYMDINRVKCYNVIPFKFN